MNFTFVEGILGMIASVIIGVGIAVTYKPIIGIAVTYLFILLVDIRYELSKGNKLTGEIK